MRILPFLTALMIPLAIDAFVYETYPNGRFSSIHVLIVKPSENIIRPAKAPTRDTVSNLARRYGAIAGVNGGFWKENGDPVGVLKIGDHWYGTITKSRGAIGWLQDGTQVLIDRFNNSTNWRQLDYIVGGTPLLVRNGKLIDDYSSEKTSESFLTKKHARTAVGIKSNGDWVFVVVDGLCFSLTGGMTMTELGTLMLNLGCINAVNLDGGGSSTMVINGLVVNQPCGSVRESGKRVEAVSDAILILPFNSTTLIK